METGEFSTNKKLDLVLKVINKAPIWYIDEENNEWIDSDMDLGKIYRTLCEDINNTSVNELKLILPFLVREGYIEKIERKKFGDDHTYYRIFYQGKVFIENGGYEGRAERENAEINRNIALTTKNTILQTTMMRLTWILAVGTSIAAIYYLIEIGRWISTFFVCE